MSHTDLERTVPSLTGEVVDDPDYLKIIYANLGIENALETYLGGRSSHDGEQAVDQLLGRFSVAIAGVADKPEGIDTGIVRFSFDHLTNNMNEVASRQFGHQPPQSATQSVLTKLGVRQPEPRQYVRPLDDRYWDKQFMDQYRTGHMVTRQPGETENQFLARYIHSCMQGFLFANFRLL
jgi:hypothetical protein